MPQSIGVYTAKCNTLNHNLFSVLLMKKTLSERTQQILDEMNLNQVQLAQLAGVTKGAVNQWLKSKPEAILSPEYAFKLSDSSRYEARWLSLGDGPELKTENLDQTTIDLAKKIAALPQDKRALLNLIFDAQGMETAQIRPKALAGDA